MTTSFCLLCTLFPGVIAVVLPPLDKEAIDLLASEFGDWNSVRERYVRYSKDYPFGWPEYGCHSPKDPLSAENAHQLAPWHITVVGALGDSLTAGRSANAKSFNEIALDFRGISFADGGDENLQTRATLPNIFKHFAGKIVGASRSISTSRNKILSQFNVAKSGAFAEDLGRQAEELANRLKNEVRVDFQRDWKFVNIFIGSNDLCQICKNQTKFGVENYRKQISNALKYLKTNVPRAYINLMPPFNIGVLKELQASHPFCLEFHRLSCPCLFTMSNETLGNHIKDFINALNSFQDIEFQAEDFAVAVSPVVANTKRLPASGSTANLAFVALDCFHFSPIAHDMVAKVVWRQLFEPVSSRRSLSLLDEVNPVLWECPPQNCPFLQTPLNSKNCSMAMIRFPSDPHISFRETVQRPLLPSESEMEIRAWTEENGSTVLLLIIGIFVLGVAIGGLSYFLQRRTQPRLNERTPLLLTANLYDDIF